MKNGDIGNMDNNRCAFMFFFVCLVLFFFYIDFLLLDIQESQDNRERGRPAPLSHFHLLHRNLVISLTITAESSILHIASSDRKSLTTKLLTFHVIG